MKKLVSVLMASCLCGCVDLAVKDVQVVEWNDSSKIVNVDIENVGFKDCDDYEVWISPEQFQQGTTLPQQYITGSYLASGDSVTLSVDFSAYGDGLNTKAISASVKSNPYNYSFMQNDRNASNNTGRTDTNLPIIIIDTLETIPDEPKVVATMKVIENPSPSGINVSAPSPGTDFNYNGNIGIELRGQLTSGFCKKQFGVETRDVSNSDLSVSLLQMPEEEDWVLYGPYSDKSMIRNVFVYEVSNLMGRYAPRTRLAEVFVNAPGLYGAGCPPDPSDHYAGVYVLMEKIKRDSNRVDIKKLKNTDNTEPDITGGYILKRDWSDPGDVNFTTNGTTGYGDTFTYVYPKCKTSACNATSQQKAWIENYINEFEAALKGPGFSDPVNGYAKYIDVDSFVDHYLIQELFKNSDGFRASTYMYKDRNGKLTMGPAWDFNFSMGNVGFPAAGPANGWLLGSVGYQIAWWDRLLQDNVFAQKVINRWNSLRAGSLADANILQLIDSKTQYLSFAQARNYARWPILGTYIVGNPSPVDPNETYADVVQYMKSWIQARTNWIDNNINSLLTP